MWEAEKLDVALNLNVPYNVIIERVKGRWVHLPSGRVYNDDFNAPKIPVSIITFFIDFHYPSFFLFKGKDDVTGEDLVKRKDDQPDVVMKRLEEYEKLTRPVINFYKELGILQEFTGKTSDEIWPQVLETLTTYIPLQIVTKKHA